MKRLSKYLNIIPVIAKGDCYTQAELIAMKEEFKK
jgi:septin family protein